MDNRDETQLEALIHRELRHLSDLPAPETLVHRVMLQVHEKARRPWWQRPWLTWPFAAQLLSLVLALASAGVVSYLVGAAWDGLQTVSLSARIAESFAWLKPIWEIGATLLGALIALLRSINPSVLIFGAGILVAAYLACIGLGTVCVRMAFNKA